MDPSPCNHSPLGKRDTAAGILLSGARAARQELERTDEREKTAKFVAVVELLDRAEGGICHGEVVRVVN